MLDIKTGELLISIPEKAGFLLRPSRYKVMFGGRGGGKSYAAATVLLMLGIAEKHRVLCTREIQRSIKDSVHKLLEDQIKALGLEKHYTVLQTEIRGKNGTEFIFSGLADQTVTSIKSMEGCTRVWCEEAQSISKRSWDILIPTIRKEGSEIWATFNPDLESDVTYQKFVVNPPDDCISVQLNYKDNPWFNQVLEKERLYCQKFNPDDYDNIWEGKCKPAVEGAIYYKQIQESEAQGRICNVPYDPMLKVHVIMDLGWEDSLSSGLVQKSVSEIRVIEYLEANHTSLDKFSAELRQRRYNWGSLILPHDGFSKQLNAKGKSTQDILKAMGWKVPDRDKIVELSIEEGIRTTRMVFPRIYFDKTKCAALQSPEPSDAFYHTELSHRLLECVKRYRRHINKATDAAGKPVRDPNAHGADMLRYLAINIDKLTNEDDTRPAYMPEATYQPFDAEIGM